MGEGVAVMLGVMVGVDTGMAEGVACRRAIGAAEGEGQREYNEGEKAGHGEGSVSLGLKARGAAA